MKQKESSRFIRAEWQFRSDDLEMSTYEKGDRRLPRPLGPLEPSRPVERPWPTPTPGVPFPDRREGDRDKILKQILDKLGEIEKRLERIEKLLSERSI